MRYYGNYYGGLSNYGAFGGLGCGCSSLRGLGYGCGYGGYGYGCGFGGYGIGPFFGGCGYGGCHPSVFGGYGFSNFC